ncbi:MAG: ATP-binding cassette domain-containing protein [Methanospirillaceae archaeon]|nr:ATP-binding cassette domain-containing protein [Methanospirillaceae archaeon]
MSTQKNPIISIRNLTKSYQIGGPQEKYKRLTESITDSVLHPRKWLSSRTCTQETFFALRDVSFDVYPGEVIGIIGRNGAGKSTLLKILSGITYPTGGEIELYGRVGSLLEVGTGFHPELTGRENIYFNGSILGMTRREIEDKFDEITKFAGVEEFLDTPVKRYSSGMAVRLGFAVAAHLDPEILLVDEVLAVGDAGFQKKCLGKMGEVAKEGRTVLFVSHNMSAITTMCKRVILIDKGELLEDGTSDEVVSHYLNTSLGTYGKTEWKDIDTAPGINGFKLISVEILNENRSPIKLVDIEKPVIVRIGYKTLIPNLKFRIAILFYCGATCAFISVEPTESVRKHNGLYYSEVTIYKNIFSERNYAINISVFSSAGAKIRFCHVENAIIFQTYDKMTGNSARGDYVQTMDGILQPKLPWITKYINGD